MMKTQIKTKADLSKAILVNEAKLGKKNFYLGGGRKEKIKFTKERLRRTYVRLMEKGICPNNISEITKGMIVKGDSAAFMVIADHGNYSIELKESDWYDAIDAVIVRHAPELIDDEMCPNYTKVVEQHVQELWLNMILQSNARIRAAECVEPEIAVKSSEKDTDTSALRKEISALQEQVILLKARLEKSTKRALRLESEISQLNLNRSKEIMDFEAKKRNEINVLKQKVQSLEAENKILQDKALYNTMGSEGSEDDGCILTDEKSVGCDLPESGVLFLGGHTNMVKKLRQRHPGWSYLGDETIPQLMTDRKVKVCFIWSKHLSHRVTHAASRNIKCTFPIVYVVSTNIELLEKEMQSGYEAILHQDPSILQK